VHTDAGIITRNISITIEQGTIGYLGLCGFSGIFRNDDILL